VPSDQVYKAPEWAKHIIWYQIFPERFYNGDRRNDPKRERVDGPEGWKISSWTTDWYKCDEWEETVGEEFRDSVRIRRYGGDLQGIIDKLDYLNDLGIGGIYLNPIFDAISHHKYDASCYHHVDRFFGPDPAGDVEIMKKEDPSDPSTWQWTSADKLFLKLIEEVHKRDMKIIIDGVFNHTGTDFWAFRDVKQKQQNSEYKDWYSIISFKNGNDSEFEYEGWWGVKDLPIFKEVDSTLVKPVREHIFDVTHRWMDPDGDGDPSDGIDGWRLDVPEEIGKGFWKEWCSAVSDINPKAYTVGEIWTKKSTDWVNGELFTAAMNYPFAGLVQDYMIDQEIGPSEFMDHLKELRRDFPDEAPFVLQNLIDSHDTPRLASMVVNPGREYDKEGRPEDGFDVRKPTTEERRIQKLIALLQFTYIGAPMIYYGTESGMWGADDPDNRKPMVWEEFDYEPEKRHPLGKQRPDDDNNFDESLYDWYKKLAEIRNQQLALQTGQFRLLLANDERNILAFSRYLSNEKFCLVVLSRSTNSQNIEIPVKEFEVDGRHLENVITRTRIQIENNKAIVKIAPTSGVILAPESN